MTNVTPSSVSPEQFAQLVPPQLTQRLLAIAHKLVDNYQSVTPGTGVSNVMGYDLEVPQTIRDGIRVLMDDILEGREPNPASRLLSLLGGVTLAKPGAWLDKLPDGAEVVAATTAIALGSGDDGSTTGTGPRQTWANQIANQRVQPLSIYRPVSLDAASDPQSIQALLTRALATGCAVKAAGSGHSYSDVATTPDFFVDTHGLNRLASEASPIAGQLSAAVLRSPLPLALGPLTFNSYDPEQNHALVEMEAGITIRALNPALESRNLGLMNMGGYDGQTIVGAISTSTHGSGIGLGPFPDMVRSLVLATTGPWKGQVLSGGGSQKGVYYYRIEPKNGITDPAKYSDPIIGLIQDDDCFSATICNMGCFGVIYSIVLEVMQMYYLSETRSLSNLAEVMQALAPNPANPRNMASVLQETRNYEVLIHPYPMSWLSVVSMDPNAPPSNYYSSFHCLVTKRNIAPPPVTPKTRPQMPSFLAILINLLIDKEPELVPNIITLSMVTLLDQDFVGKSYDIYNLGLGGNFGFAAEIGFSAESSGSYSNAGFQAAINKIHLIAQTSRVEGSQYQTSPFSLRFVKSSGALLSMMQGRDTAMIEMDMVTGTYGGAEVMYRYETNMYPLGGRPHWGLEFDSMSGSNGLLSRLYPELARWLAVYRQFNALGTFDNSFTQRVGFSTPATP